MSIDKDLLENCLSNGLYKLEIPESLFKEYLELENYLEKREIAIKIIKSLFKKYFKKFKKGFELIKALKNFEENLLYKYLLYYRDHFLHSLQIFLLGFYMMRKVNTLGMPIEFLSKRDYEGFIRTWLLISVFHDIGYLAQTLMDISDKINTLYFKNISGINLSKLELNFSEKLEDIFKKILEELAEGIIIGEDKYYFSNSKSDIYDNQKDIILNELMESYFERNHGIISSLFSYYTLNLDINYIKKEKRDLLLKEIKLACAAIATHDLEKIKKIHLDFRDNPFACLLILCDNIQEWNRPYNLKLENSSEDIWKKFELDYLKDKECYCLIFYLLESQEKKIETIKENLFKEIKRIFKYSIISGPNFSFIIRSNEKEFEIKANFDDKQNFYLIE